VRFDAGFFYFFSYSWSFAMQFFQQIFLQKYVRTSISALFGLLVCTTTLLAQQEQRVTEKRTVTDETGQTRKTTEIVESKVEDISPTVQNIIHTGAVRLAWMYNLNYTRAISNNVAISGGLELPTSIAGPFSPKGFGAVAEARFYPGNMALRGFYLAGGLNFHSLRTRSVDYEPGPTPTSTPTITEVERNFTPLSIGITTGWVILAWNELSIDLGLGVKHHLISAEYKARFGYAETITSIGPDVFGGTAPTVRINVGYAWK
jgi:hypothetical protein